MALAIDHRAQLEEIADDVGAPRERIADFKRARRRGRGARSRTAGRGFGMLLDGTYGREALFDAADHDFWIGRPVELPGSRPLRFEVSPGSSARSSSNGRSSHYDQVPVLLPPRRSGRS